MWILSTLGLATIILVFYVCRSTSPLDLTSIILPNISASTAVSTINRNSHINSDIFRNVSNMRCNMSKFKNTPHLTTMCVITERKKHYNDIKRG